MTCKVPVQTDANRTRVWIERDSLVSRSLHSVGESPFESITHSCISRWGFPLTQSQHISNHCTRQTYAQLDELHKYSNYFVNTLPPTLGMLPN
jgi:hypothetical protein